MILKNESLRRVAVLHPLVPPVNRDDHAALRPDLFEELARGHCLHLSVYWIGSFPPRPKGRPSPADLVDVQARVVTSKNPY